MGAKPEQTVAGVVLLLAGAGVVVGRAVVRRRQKRRALDASRDRAFAELLSAVRQRDDTLAHVTHDLRTPLTALKGQAQLLQRFLRSADSPDADRLRAGLAAIDAAATAAAERIDRLTDEGNARTS